MGRLVYMMNRNSPTLHGMAKKYQVFSARCTSKIHWVTGSFLFYSKYSRLCPRSFGMCTTVCNVRNGEEDPSSDWYRYACNSNSYVCNVWREKSLPETIFENRTQDLLNVDEALLPLSHHWVTSGRWAEYAWCTAHLKANQYFSLRTVWLSSSYIQIYWAEGSSV